MLWGDLPAQNTAVDPNIRQSNVPKPISKEPRELSFCELWGSASGIALGLILGALVLRSNLSSDPNILQAKAVSLVSKEGRNGSL